MSPGIRIAQSRQGQEATAAIEVWDTDAKSWTRKEEKQKQSCVDVKEYMFIATIDTSFPIFNSAPTNHIPNNMFCSTHHIPILHSAPPPS